MQITHPRYSFVSWKGIGPEHSEWLSGFDLMNATEVVQDYLDPVQTLWGYRA